ncbi:MAG: hypothetical protein WCF93_00685 [Candidatus Moraniibacteriota bacterium]
MSDVKLAAYEKKDNLAATRKQKTSPANFHVPQKPENHAQDNNKEGHSERLEEARRSSIPKLNNLNKNNAVSAVKNLASAASLWKYVDPIGDMPFVPALGGALLKDFLDIVDFETVILPMLFSALCSILIFMMLLLVGSSEKKKGASKFVQKVLTILGGGIADSMPGLDFLPIETITVLAVYYMTLVERKEAAQG